MSNCRRGLVRKEPTCRKATSIDKRAMATHPEPRSFVEDGCPKSKPSSKITDTTGSSGNIIAKEPVIVTSKRTKGCVK